MGGGDLNMKKSWHPLLQVNQERVWKREKEALEERKKLEELRREREQEREMQELQRLQEEAGGKKRIDRVDWMYATPATNGSKSAAEMEEYLLGKKRVDKLLQGDEADKVSKSSQQSLISLQNANSARDLAAKVREDPMLAIKQQEQAAYEALLRDPARLRKLKMQAGIDVDADSKQESRRRKEEKRRRHDHESSRRRHRDEDDSSRRRTRDQRHHDSESRRHRHHRHEDDKQRDRSPSRRDSERRSSRRYSPDPRHEADRDIKRSHERRSRDDEREHASRSSRSTHEEHDRDTSAADRAYRPRTATRSRSRSRSPEQERRGLDDYARRPRDDHRPSEDRRDRFSSRDRPSGPSSRANEDDKRRKEALRLERLREMEQNAKSMEQQRSSYVHKINAEEEQQDRREAELRQKLLDARAKGRSDGKGDFLHDQQRKTFGDAVDLAERMRRDRGRLQRLD